jgi:hypothetical protein
MGYVDGSTSAPSKQVPSSIAEGAALINNPAYDRWHGQDQLLLSGLLPSMIEDVLCDAVMAKTTQDAWDILNRMFGSASRTWVVQIRMELATTKKRDLSVDYYFCKIKSLAFEMASVGAPLRDDER